MPNNSSIRKAAFAAYSNLSKNELKEICRERKIPWGGNPSCYMFVTALADWDEKRVGLIDEHYITAYQIAYLWAFYEQDGYCLDLRVMRKMIDKNDPRSITYIAGIRDGAFMGARDRGSNG